jgi:dihydropyrimidinase
MQAFDLIIRNSTVVTAVDSTPCDVGIRDGRITALGTALGSATREIDATGGLVLPGGIDRPLPHPTALRRRNRQGRHVRERYDLGSVWRHHLHDLLLSQFMGHGIAERAQDYHARARKAVIDYRVLSSSTPKIMRP